MASHNATSSGIASPATFPGFSSPVGLTPAQIRGAYGVGNISFGGITGDGTGQTIAIIDAYDAPTIVSDLHNFDAAFGLPDPPSFTRLNQAGGTTLPGTDPNGPYSTTGGSDWEQEASLDVEWAHVMAPNASIILYEASNAGSGLFTALSTARKAAGVTVVSMSWGGSEFSGQSSYDSTYFTTPSGHIGAGGVVGGITYLASTGDSGAYDPNNPSTIAVEYPASSSNVIGVGGTTLHVSGSSYGSETGWGNGTTSVTKGGSGGGISSVESQPAYQNGIVTQSTTQRTIPDISLEADPNTGVPIYDSWDFGASTPWVPGYEGGTSLACPMWAGLIAIADQDRALKGLGSLNGQTQTLPRIYELPASDFHDVTSGNNGYAAGAGYDLVTGRGTPITNTLVPDLALGVAVSVGGSNVYAKQDADGTHLDLWANSATPGTGSPTQQTLLNFTSSITFNGTNGLLTLDYSVGNFASGLVNGITFNGSGGNNTIAFGGTSGNDTLTATATTITPSGGLGSTPVTVSNVQTIQFNGGSGGTDSLNVTASPSGGYTVNADTQSGTPNVSVAVSGSGTVVNFAATQHLAALSIGADSRVVLAASATAAAKVLVTSSVSISGTGVDMGVLDLTNNAAIINYVSGNSPLSVVQALINDARNGGGWTGKGITSSNASADRAAHGLETTAVGYADNASLLAPYSKFAGQTVIRNAVLLRYTVVGDADLNGVVNDDDVGILNLYYDNGATTGHDWQQGDFTFDGKVNDDDAGLVGLFYGSSVPGYAGV